MNVQILIFENERQWLKILMNIRAQPRYREKKENQAMNINYPWILLLHLFHWKPRTFIAGCYG